MKSLQEFKDKMAEFAADIDGRPKPGPDDCQGCGAKPPHKFNDRVSTLEYTISGLCQNCQDEVFSDADGFDDGLEIPDDYPVF